MFWMWPYFIVLPIIGVLFGILALYLGRVVSYTQNFWLYLIMKLGDTNQTAEPIKSNEIAEGARLTKILGTLLKVVGIVSIVLGTIGPITMVFVSITEKLWQN